MRRFFRLLMCKTIGHNKVVCDRTVFMGLNVETHVHWCERCLSVLYTNVSTIPVEFTNILKTDPGLAHDDAKKYMH